MQTLGEYLRVDEIAARFGVSIEDVLRACSVVGFSGAHDASSLIELDLFTHAILTTPIAPHDAEPVRNRLHVPVLALTAMVAALAIVVGVIASWTNTSAPPSADARAAAYHARLKATYDATVAAQPKASDYLALAEQLRDITPPPGLRAEHDKLVTEAENVANLAGASSPQCADVPSVYAGEGSPDQTCTGDQLSSAFEAASAANALKDEIGTKTARK